MEYKEKEKPTQEAAESRDELLNTSTVYSTVGDLYDFCLQLTGFVRIAAFEASWDETNFINEQTLKVFDENFAANVKQCIEFRKTTENNRACLSEQGVFEKPVGNTSVATGLKIYRNAFAPVYSSFLRS